MKKDVITFKEVINKVWKCNEGKEVINFIMDNMNDIINNCAINNHWAYIFDKDIDTVKLYNYFNKKIKTFKIGYIGDIICKWLRENDYKTELDSIIKEKINKIEEELEKLKEELNH